MIPKTVRNIGIWGYLILRFTPVDVQAPAGLARITSHSREEGSESSGRPDLARVEVCKVVQPVPRLGGNLMVPSDLMIFVAH